MTLLYNKTIDWRGVIGIFVLVQLLLKKELFLRLEPLHCYQFSRLHSNHFSQSQAFLTLRTLLSQFPIRRSLLGDVTVNTLKVEFHSLLESA